MIGYEGGTWYLYNAEQRLEEVEVEPIYKYVSGTSVNVREEASSKSNSITKLPRNTQVEWIYETNGWSYIRFGENQYGFMSSSYLAEEPLN